MWIFLTSRAMEFTYGIRDEIQYTIEHCAGFDVTNGDMYLTHQDWPIKAAVVCSQEDCERLYPASDESTIALRLDTEGLGRPDSYNPLQDDDIIFCKCCGTQYVIRLDWPRNVEMGNAAVPKCYAHKGKV